MTRLFISLVLPGVLTLCAQTPSKSFEVASVRPHQGTTMRSGPLTISGSTVRLEGYTIFGLLLDAWNLRSYQLSAGPGAVARPEELLDTMYDVVARAPGSGTPTVEDVREMLQSLLRERFGLRIHRESKDMPVYLLTAGKGGLKLKTSGASGVCSVRGAMAADRRNTETTFTNCGPDRLTGEVANLMQDRPVVDRTGISGNFDFKLTAVSDFRSRSGADDADVSPIAALSDLGLKLEKGREEVEVYVVDSVGKLKEN